MSSSPCIAIGCCTSLCSRLLYLSVLLSGQALHDYSDSRLAYWKAQAHLLPSCCVGAKQSSGPLLRLLVQAHNLFLIALSSWMSVSACVQAWRLRYRFWGTAYSDAHGSMAIVVYVFYVSKLYEFMDTVRGSADGERRLLLPGA